MQFIVHPQIFDRFPSMRLAVAVAHGVDNQKQRPQITARWQEVWAEATKAAVYGNAQSHPQVKPWRARFQAMGISGKEFPSSIEALLRRALKGGIPFEINPLVDFYNTVSLQHIVPVGAFDLRLLHGPLELRLTQQEDQFIALDAESPVTVPPGEIAYADGQAILTRHFVWRQDRTSLITLATQEVFLVSEVPGEVGKKVAEAVLIDFRTGLQEYFGVTPQTFLVDAQNRSVSW